MSEEDFKDENVKIRITTFVDMDVYKQLKKLAGDRGYQTLLNEILRSAVTKKVPKISQLIETIKKLNEKSEELRKELKHA